MIKEVIKVGIYGVFKIDVLKSNIIEVHFIYTIFKKEIRINCLTLEVKTIGIVLDISEVVDNFMVLMDSFEDDID